MDRESMAHLRLDRRLIRRRRWIPADELQRELEQLPDSAHKATRGDQEPVAPTPPDTSGDV
jgi:hypothetical protein